MAVAVLVLSPSILAVGVFIYTFIVWSFFISGTKWNSAVFDTTWVGLDNWLNVFTTDRFQTDVRNLVLYATGFMTQCIVLGFCLAVLIDQKVKGESLFRAIFIFPFAVSVAGAWQFSGYVMALYLAGLRGISNDSREAAPCWVPAQPSAPMPCRTSCSA
jgi:ABC-type sugar transport system permease subunit